ncbi:hypothetical protein IJ732_04410, partial [bacterium]|nr:hypothetical protein [bacterium]
AKKYCESQGLRLPTVSELQMLQSTCSTNGLGCSGHFWSSEGAVSDEPYAYAVDFSGGGYAYFCLRGGDPSIAGPFV